MDRYATIFHSLSEDKAHSSRGNPMVCVEIASSLTPRNDDDGCAPSLRGLQILSVGLLGNLRFASIDRRMNRYQAAAIPLRLSRLLRRSLLAMTRTVVEIASFPTRRDRLLAPRNDEGALISN